MMFKNLFVAVIAFWAFFLGVTVVQSHYRTLLIQHGYGQYCPTDGHFAFKGECDK